MIKKVIVGGIIFLALFFIISAAAISSAFSVGLANEAQNNVETDFDDDVIYEGEYKGGKFIFPAPKMTRVSSEYGSRTPPHGGIDLAAPGGSPILACADGIVVVAEYHYSWGNHVRINHGGNMYTLYAHASKLLVKKGDKVKAGQQIAKIGTTGSSTGNHLHLEVWKGYGTKYRVNPRPYIFGN